MKIIEAIEAIDTLKPNTYTAEEKVKWLSKLDEQIFNEIVMTHEHFGTEDQWTPYDENTDTEKEMLVKTPYDYDLYVSYLESKIDYYNGETTRFNNTAQMFNAKYDDYARFYNRSRMPIRGHIRFF